MLLYLVNTVLLHIVLGKLILSDLGVQINSENLFKIRKKHLPVDFKITYQCQFLIVNFK